MQRFLIITVILFSIVLLTTGPLWDARMFFSHENMLPAFRAAEIHRNVLDGHPFSKWFPDYALGLGLPQLVFFPPASLYITELFHLAGANLFTALKLAFALATLLTAVGTFLWTRDVWGDSGGLVAAAAAVFAPYHLFNIYVRGDLHEYLALAWLPWTLWAVHRLAIRPSWPKTAAAALPYAALIMSHNLTAVLFTPALMLYLVLAAVFYRSIGPLVRGFVAMALAVGLTAGFWLPALIEKDFVQIEVLTKGFGDFRNHFIGFSQFFSMYWGFGASISGPGDTVSFQIGNVLLGCAALALFACWRSARFQNEDAYLIYFSLALLPLSICLMMSFSAPVWEHAPLLRFFQFPYRFLALTTLGGAFLAGGVVELVWPPRRKAAVAAAAIAALVLVNIRYASVIGYSEVSPGEITPANVARARETLATGEYIPRGVTEFPPPKQLSFALQKIPEAGFTRDEMDVKLRERFAREKTLDLWTWKRVPVGGQKVEPQRPEIISGAGSIAGFNFGGSAMELHALMSEPGYVRFGTFNFPGWTATVNGERRDVSTEVRTGLITIRLPKGAQHVVLTFGPTPLRRNAAIASGASAVLVLALLLLGLRRQRGGPMPVRIR